MSDYLIKRKAFNVKEVIDEKHQIIERKNRLFFVTHFDDAISFDRALRINKGFDSRGIQVPKIKFKNKANNDLIYEYFDADRVIKDLQFGDLKEEVYDELFKMFWRCKQEKMTLDFDPENFIFFNGKLYYLSLKLSKLENKDDFLNHDLKMWFYTKELEKLLKEKGLKTEGKVEEEYATNKRITLMCVKYYR